MPASKRLLFIAGEITPFAEASETATLVRTLSEKLREQGDFDARIMIPHYGAISERKNGLHEVIRLSGTDISIGDQKETLTVKVASLPDLRLQVYFMSNDTYFERKGMAVDENDAPYEDNAERVLFFTRAMMETIKSLRWAPDLVHAFGWMGGLAPLLLRTEGLGEELFNGTRTVYTPDGLDAGKGLSESFVEKAGPTVNEAADSTFDEAGLASADATIHPPSLTPDQDADPQFSDAVDDNVQQAAGLYDNLLAEDKVAA